MKALPYHGSDDVRDPLASFHRSSAAAGHQCPGGMALLPDGRRLSPPACGRLLVRKASNAWKNIPGTSK